MRPSLSMRRKRYKGIGLCIYCLKPFVPDQLTREHIIPDALRGTLIFENAVCANCQRITGKDESEALKQELLVPRVLLNLKPKNQVLPLPLVFIGSHDDAEAPIADEKYKGLS